MAGTDRHFDHTLSADGLTVRLIRAGSNLTLVLEDAVGAIEEVHVSDGIAGRTLATVDDLRSPGGAAGALKPMFALVKTFGQGHVDHLIAALAPDGCIGGAGMEALWRAVSNENRSGEWGAVMARVRDAFAARGLERAHAANPPFLAAAFRDLIGVHGFTADHYEAMTLPWRALFSGSLLYAPIHPDDTDPTDEPEGAIRLPQRTALGIAASQAPHVSPSQLEYLLHRAAQEDGKARSDAFTRAEELATDLGRERIWQWVTAMASRKLTAGPPLIDEVMTELRHAMLGLVLRDRIGQGVTQNDYDLLTGPWRSVIADLHPDDIQLAG